MSQKLDGMNAVVVLNRQRVLQYLNYKNSFIQIFTKTSVEQKQHYSFHYTKKHLYNIFFPINFIETFLCQYINIKEQNI